jgi:hypothetical protein
MSQYKSNLQIFFTGGYLEDEIVPLRTDFPEHMEVKDVDAWQVILEDLEEDDKQQVLNLGLYKSHDPQTNFFLLLSKGKGATFQGEKPIEGLNDFLSENGYNFRVDTNLQVKVFEND